MKLLKQNGTGDIYPWTPELAERPDMVEFTRGEPAPTAVAEVADEPKVEASAPEAAPQETPTENSESASADDGLPPLDDAIEAFRRQASKSPKKTRADESNG
jgi:hypothetical protein